MIDVGLVSLLLTLNSFNKFFWSFRSWFEQVNVGWVERVIINQPLNIFTKKLHHRCSSGPWIRLCFKVNLHSKIKCICLLCICNFQMNFFYFASFFIGFPPASVPYKQTFSITFLASWTVWRSREKSRKCEQKIEADQGNDMTIADSC